MSPLYTKPSPSCRSIWTSWRLSYLLQRTLHFQRSKVSFWKRSFTSGTSFLYNSLAAAPLRVLRHNPAPPLWIMKIYTNTYLQITSMASSNFSQRCDQCSVAMPTSLNYSPVSVIKENSKLWIIVHRMIMTLWFNLRLLNPIYMYQLRFDCRRSHVFRIWEHSLWKTFSTKR